MKNFKLKRGSVGSNINTVSEKQECVIFSEVLGFFFLGGFRWCNPVQNPLFANNFLFVEHFALFDSIT